MNRQTGTILMILLIVMTLTSITSIVILQSGLSFKKQINLLKLQQKSNEITNTESSAKAGNITPGVDINLLPLTETAIHQFENHQFTTTQITISNPLVNSPLNGYSLNSVYKTQLVELITGTSSSMAKSSNIIIGFGCILVENIELSNQIESTYSLDIDQDSIIDASYEYDSANGDIFRVDYSAQLLINLALDTEQSFSRPQFSVFDFNESSKLAYAFVVQNTGSVAQTADNSFYLLFDKPLFGASTPPTINLNELVDLNTNPIFSVTDKGYFLKLDQGQLISSAITLFNQNIFFTTQSPSVDPNTGLTQYTNKLITIKLNNGSMIIPSIQEITGSVSLLELALATHNDLTITLNSQFETLVNLPGECRPIYHYEN